MPRSGASEEGAPSGTYPVSTGVSECGTRELSVAPLHAFRGYPGVDPTTEGARYGKGALTTRTFGAGLHVSVTNAPAGRPDLASLRT